MIRNSNRTKKTFDAYQEYKQKQREGYADEFLFHEDPGEILKEYIHWFIRKNRFPYDMIFERHDMLIPREEIKNYESMSKEQLAEYIVIREEVCEEYDGILENFSSAKSVQAHFHPHLFTWKKIEER